MLKAPMPCPAMPHSPGNCLNGGNPDIIRLSDGKALMYYGDNLGADGFGVRVAKAIGNIVP